MALHTGREARDEANRDGPEAPVRFLEAWCARAWTAELATGGVHIELVDGPAWRVRIDLDGTPLEGLVREATDHQDPAGWWHWWAEGDTFHLVAALSHLVEGLAEFQRVASPVD